MCKRSGAPHGLWVAGGSREAHLRHKGMDVTSGNSTASLLFFVWPLLQRQHSPEKYLFKVPGTRTRGTGPQVPWIGGVFPGDRVFVDTSGQRSENNVP